MSKDRVAEAACKLCTQLQLSWKLNYLFFFFLFVFYCESFPVPRDSVIRGCEGDRKPGRRWEEEKEEQETRKGTYRGLVYYAEVPSF